MAEKKSVAECGERQVSFFEALAGSNTVISDYDRFFAFGRLEQIVSVKTNGGKESPLLKVMIKGSDVLMRAYPKFNIGDTVAAVIDSQPAVRVRVTSITFWEGSRREDGSIDKDRCFWRIGGDVLPENEKIVSNKKRKQPCHGDRVGVQLHGMVYGFKKNGESVERAKDRILLEAESRINASTDLRAHILSRA